MRALVLDRTRGLHMRQVPVPRPKAGEVLIRTAYTGVSSTDRGIYQGAPGSIEANLPIILGHENCGTVAAIGTRSVTLADGGQAAKGGQGGRGP